MKKLLLITILTIKALYIYAQDGPADDSAVQPYDEDGGTFFNKSDTIFGDYNRSYPGNALNGYKIIPCRENDPFPYKYKIFDLKINKDINYSKIIDYKYTFNLCKLAWDTKDQKYLYLLIKYIFTDTLKKDHNYLVVMAKCLSIYNNDVSKNALIKMLSGNDNELATIAAVILVKFEKYNISLNYFKEKYNNVFYPEQVFNALKEINSKESISLLKQLISKQKNILMALDGIATLSLMGQCEYAFDKFVKYTKNSNNIVRRNAAICLGYYIGTLGAFEVIKGMQNDKNNYVNKTVKSILDNYIHQLK